MWDGGTTIWTYKGEEGWFSLDAAQFPSFAHISIPSRRRTSPDFRRRSLVQSRSLAGLIQLGVDSSPAPRRAGACWCGLRPTWRATATKTMRKSSKPTAGSVRCSSTKLTRTNVRSNSTPISLLSPGPAHSPQSVATRQPVRWSRTRQLSGDWDAFRDTVVRSQALSPSPAGDYAAQTRRRRKSKPPPDK